MKYFTLTHAGNVFNQTDLVCEPAVTFDIKFNDMYNFMLLAFRLNHLQKQNYLKNIETSKSVCPARAPATLHRVLTFYK